MSGTSEVSKFPSVGFDCILSARLENIIVSDPETSSSLPVVTVAPPDMSTVRRRVFPLSAANQEIRNQLQARVTALSNQGSGSSGTASAVGNRILSSSSDERPTTPTNQMIVVADPTTPVQQAVGPIVPTTPEGHGIPVPTSPPPVKRQKR